MCALTRSGQLSVCMRSYFEKTDRESTLHRDLTPVSGRDVSTRAKHGVACTSNNSQEIKISNNHRLILDSSGAFCSPCEGQPPW